MNPSEYYKAALDRLDDLRGPANDVHREFLDHQRRVQIANERRLGPSLQDARHADHIFQIDRHRYVFGTSVPYSRAHRRWRIDNGRGDFMAIPPDVLRRMADHIMRHALGGRR